MKALEEDTEFDYPSDLASAIGSLVAVYDAINDSGMDIDGIGASPQSQVKSLSRVRKSIHHRSNPSFYPLPFL